MQLYISWMTVNVSLSYSVSGADHEHLMMLVEPAQCTGTVCDDYVVRMVGNYAWSRAGSVEAVSERQLHYEPWGLPSADLFVVTSKSSAALDGDQYKARHLRHAITHATHNATNHIHTLKVGVGGCRGCRPRTDRLWCCR